MFGDALAQQSVSPSSVEHSQHGECAVTRAAVTGGVGAVGGINIAKVIGDDQTAKSDHGERDIQIQRMCECVNACAKIQIVAPLERRRNAECRKKKGRS